MFADDNDPSVLDFVREMSAALRAAWEARGAACENSDGEGDFVVRIGELSLSVIFDMREGRFDAVVRHEQRGETVRAFEIARTCLAHPFDESVFVDALADPSPAKAERFVAYLDDTLREWASGKLDSFIAIVETRAALKKKASMNDASLTRLSLPIDEGVIVPPTVALFIDAMSPLLVEGWKNVSFAAAESGYAMSVEHESGLTFVTRFFITIEDRTELYAFDARSGLVDVRDAKAVNVDRLVKHFELELPRNWFAVYGFRRLRAYAEALSELDAVLDGDLSILTELP